MDAKKTEIAFQIGPDGEVTFEVKGVKGAECLALTQDLEEELGVVVSREKTSEYYEQPLEEGRTLTLEEG